MATGNDSPFVEKYLMPLAVLLGLIIIAVAIAFGGKGAQPTPVGEEGSVPVDIASAKLDTSPSIGEKSAPVTIAVWFDYQCRYCKQFELTTLSQVQQEYVAQGKVRIVYKDYQFLGPLSNEIALYSRAVWDAYPDKWDDWFITVFKGTEGAEGSLDVAGVTKIATDLGMDTGRLTRLMTDKKAEYQAAIDADRVEGQNFGITGTPGSIIGTTLVGGAQPYANVKALIDAELAK